MSSMAFCSAISGFSRPVETSKLRTATALSFAIMVGLPTCKPCQTANVQCASWWRGILITISLERRRWGGEFSSNNQSAAFSFLPKQIESKTVLLYAEPPLSQALGHEIAHNSEQLLDRYTVYYPWLLMQPLKCISMHCAAQINLCLNACCIWCNTSMTQVFY